MAITTLILTKDRYLFQALNALINGVQWVRDSERSDFIDELYQGEYRILIDNRIPYIEYENLRSHLNKNNSGVDCILLEMRNAIYFRQGYRYIKKIKMTYSVKELARALQSKFRERKYFPNDKQKSIRCYLTNLDKKMIIMAINGVHTKNIGKVCKCSDTQLYYRRGKMYRMLGMVSYNQACVFILQNKLVEVIPNDDS
jgi:hypothetical protein